MQFGTFLPEPADGTKRPKALSFISYHIYRDSLGTYTDDGSVPLSEYLKVQDRMSALPVIAGRSGSMPTLFDLPGETMIPSKRVATQEGIIFAQSLNQILWEVEKNGECLAFFDARNIRIGEKKCVLENVQRQKLDLRQLESNYKCAKKIVADAFAKDGAIPDDIHHLLQLMEKEFDKRSLFRVHASLWSLSIRGGMCMRLHEHLKVLSGTTYYQILCEMGKLKCIASWRHAAQSNDLLKEIYVFKKSQYAKENCSIGSMAEKFSEGKIFTDYLRNRVAHRMDQFNSARPYTAQGSELAALVRWPLALVTLQYELHKCKASGDLNEGELY